MYKLDTCGSAPILNSKDANKTDKKAARKAKDAQQKLNLVEKAARAAAIKSNNEHRHQVWNEQVARQTAAKVATNQVARPQ